MRARRPYRLLDCSTYQLTVDLLLESLDTVSFKTPIPPDGACVFTGKTAIYRGTEASLDDGVGHHLTLGVPVAVCDKTATHLARRFPEQVLITPSTWNYEGGGCC